MRVFAQPHWWWGSWSVDEEEGYEYLYVSSEEVRHACLD